MALEHLISKMIIVRANWLMIYITMPSSSLDELKMIAVTWYDKKNKFNVDYQPSCLLA